jgi:hypothetical protein
MSWDITSWEGSCGIVRLNAEDVIRLFLRHTPQMRTSVSRYYRHRLPAQISAIPEGRNVLCKGLWAHDLHDVGCGDPFGLPGLC